MSDFIKYCQIISPLSDEICSDISANLKLSMIKKGELINKQGRIAKSLYFIDKGLVKHFYYHKDRTFILQFFDDKKFFIVLDSFLAQTPSEFMTIALEDTELAYLEYVDIERLCRKYHQFETFFRKLISLTSLGVFKRFKEIFEEEATELYRKFVENNNHLLQRISLGDIAAYLGISQVTLSRIRAKKK